MIILRMLKKGKGPNFYEKLFRIANNIRKSVKTISHKIQLGRYFAAV